MSKRASELSTLLNPWLFLVCTIGPQLLLASAGAYAYKMVRAELSTEQIAAWHLLAGMLGAAAAVSAALALYCLQRRRPLPWQQAPFHLAGYSAWLYLALSQYTRLFPVSLPRWILAPEEYFLAPGAFLMPGILYALLTIVYRFTPPRAAGWPNLVAGAGIAALWYLFFHVVLPARRYRHDDLTWHVISVVFVVSAVLFILLLLRWLLVLARSESPRWKLGLKLIFGLVLPLIGLGVNGSIEALWPEPLYHIGYGNYDNQWFTILAVLNGLVLLLPSPAGTRRRFAVYLLRTACLPFSLYFFLAFMPLLPFAVALIVLVGVGFLVLDPAILFWLHLKTLREDLAGLRPALKLPVLLIPSAAAFLLLPGTVLLSLYCDRQVLHDALARAKRPDYLADADSPDRSRLEAVLKRASRYKGRKEGLMEQTPLLDPLFRYIVLDNLTISDKTISELGAQYELALERLQPRFEARPFARARIDSALASSAVTTDALESTVTLTISHSGSQESEEELREELTLPPGAWISGLTLRIGEEDVPGMLVETGAAQWVYRQIVSQRRDPALLYYIGTHRLRLHVFPVHNVAPRVMTFKVLHREPFTLRLGGHQVQLGRPDDETPPTERPVAAGRLLYVSAAAKGTLERVARTPFLYFIVECGSGENSWQAPLIEEFVAGHGAQALGAPRMLVGSSTFHEVPFASGWQQEVSKCRRQGRFDLDAAMKSALLRSTARAKESYPLPVIVTANESGAKAPENLELFLAFYPELDRAAVLSGVGSTWRELPTLRQLDESFNVHSLRPVLVWPDKAQPRAFVSAAHEAAEAPFLPAEPGLESAPLHGRWGEALGLRSLWVQQQLYPAAASDDAWRMLVVESTRQGIMTPPTSYTVLETEAQREALRQLHQQRLNGNRLLDAGEMQRMDEPAFELLLAAWLLILAARRSSGTRNKPAAGGLHAGSW